MNRNEEDALLAQLLELRRSVAETLGREQYVYQVLDRAIESGHRPTRERALEEFQRQPDEVRQRILCR